MESQLVFQKKTWRIYDVHTSIYAISTHPKTNKKFKSKFNQRWNECFYFIWYQFCKLIPTIKHWMLCIQKQIKNSKNKVTKSVKTGTIIVRESDYSQILEPNQVTYGN